MCSMRNSLQRQEATHSYSNKRRGADRGAPEFRRRPDGPSPGGRRRRAPPGRPSGRGGGRRTGRDGARSREGGRRRELPPRGSARLSPRRRGASSARVLRLIRTREKWRRRLGGAGPREPRRRGRRRAQPPARVHDHPSKYILRSPEAKKTGPTSDALRPTTDARRCRTSTGWRLVWRSDAGCQRRR